MQTYIDVTDVDRDTPAALLLAYGLDYAVWYSQLPGSALDSESRIRTLCTGGNALGVVQTDIPTDIPNKYLK